MRHDHPTPVIEVLGPRPTTPGKLTAHDVLSFLEQHAPPGPKAYWRGHACRYALMLNHLLSAHPKLWKAGVSRPAGARPLRILCAGDKGAQTLLVKWLLPMADVVSTSLFEAGNWSVAGMDGASVTFELQRVSLDEDVWPFGTGSFDAVLCWEVLEHLFHDPAFAMLEARRVLVHGGLLQVTTPNPDSCRTLSFLLAGEQHRH